MYVFMSFFSSDEIIGFVHNVTQIRKSVDGNDYFECLLQQKDSNQKTICLTPSKKRCLDDAVSSKIPVKISNFNISGDRMFINSQTMISPRPLEDADFNFNAKLSSDAVLSISDLSEITAGQLVSLKAYVVSVSDSITHHGHQGTISKKEAIICDESKTCKLTLYGDDVDAIESGKTYVMKNMRLNRTRNTIYLNTTAKNPFQARPAPAFTNLSKQDCKTESTGCFKIIGVSTVSKSCQCPMCGRFTTKNEFQQLKCNECKITLREEDCTGKWSVNLAMKEVDSGETVKIFFPNNQTRELAKLMNYEIISQEDFEKKLLQTTIMMDITFDAISKRAIIVKSH